MTTGPGTVSVLEIASPLPFIARRSPQATQLQRRVLGVRAGPHPALTLGAMKHTRPFIARRPGPEVAGETAPGAGSIVLLLLLLLLIDRPLDQERALPYGRGSEWAPCA